MASTSQAHIAIVEDDDTIRELIAEQLIEDGFTPYSCKDAETMFALLTEAPLDAVLLDIMMPGVDGLQVCRRLRKESAVPILFVSAKCADIDRILGLELGADDFITKPFNPRELSARLRAVLRRAGRDGLTYANEAKECYTFLDFHLDWRARQLTDPAGRNVRLTSGELSLLMAFVRNANRVLTREQLLDWTRTPGAAPYDRAIDVQLSRLRARLGDDTSDPKIIKTIRGEGYLFAPRVTRDLR